MAIKLAKQQESVQESLQQVLHILNRHKMVEELVQKQDQPRQALVERLVHRQNLVELQKKLEDLHNADVAYILEALPYEERLLVWDLVKVARGGEILLEVSDAVREMLLANMQEHEILAATEQLDADEIADLAPDLPEKVVTQLLSSLEENERADLQTALSFHEDEVGGQMDFDMVAIRDDVKLEVILRYLRRFESLPHHTDKLFVVDDHEILQGVLPLNRLLVGHPSQLVRDVMVKDVVFFHTDEDVRDAAQAFERYDLISAPVIDANHKVVGRLTVDMMVDVMLDASDAETLSLAGLKEDEDLFSSVWQSAKNRWAWLAINLCTAFIASRVIGAFEGTISKLVALATLMPIVAGIGGNTGNQTSTLIIRGIALGQITGGNARRLVSKELGVALLNGLVWGSALGLIAYWLYGQFSLGCVMTAAMILNLQVAAMVGIFVPLMMHKLGRDPAYGSSVLLTATTDSMGFFIFLGLASIFLH